MEDLETSATLDFHGVRYVVTVQVQQQLLHVQVEVADVAAAPSSVWTSRFPASDIEQLTRQTGNSKRFPVFVQMLLTALHRRSDTVFVDLLTTTDLDLYRQRKLQPGSVLEGLPSASTGTKTEKRYLILTYAVEFDRVHYPLPLTQEPSPSPEVLQRTIRRLSHALAAKATECASESTSQLAEENRALREENGCLKKTLKQYCDEAGGRGMEGIKTTNELERELETSMGETKELRALYQQLKEDSVVEMARLQMEIKQLRLASQLELASPEQEDLATGRNFDCTGATQAPLAQRMDMKAQLEETRQTNRALRRQLAIARAQSGQPSTRPRPVFTPSPTPELSRYARGRSPSTRSVRASTAMKPQQDDPTVFSTPFQGALPRIGRSDAKDRLLLTSRATPRAPFRRFDPSAYQREKERKLCTARANVKARRPRSHRGFSSDSTAGGYSSAESRDSKTSSRSTQSRSSRVSRERQRELDVRLSSPKPTLERPRLSTRRLPPRSSRGRSPSPTLTTRSPQSEAATRNPSVEPLPSSDASPRQLHKHSPLSKRRKHPLPVLQTTSVNSFSEIDERLTALQAFLREAKENASGAANASTAAGSRRNNVM